MAEAMNPAPDEPRYPCSVCGRKFVRASLQKHEPNCQPKKRKVFDSGKQRATGDTDVTLQDVRRAQKELAQNAGRFKPPETKWREQHDRFQDGIRAAKNVDFALKTGSPLPPPPKARVPSNYVECPHCGRNFNETAAERHIPFCEKQSQRKPAKPPRARSQPPKAPPPQRRKPRSPSPPPSPPIRRRGHSIDNRPQPRRRSQDEGPLGPPRGAPLRAPPRRGSENGYDTRAPRGRLPQPVRGNARRQSPASRMMNNQRGRRF